MHSNACISCHTAGEVISPNHVDHRRCAFDENGIFTDDNYCCVTMLQLRRIALYLGTYSVTMDGEHHATLSPSASPDELIVIDWYKQRGRTQAALSGTGGPLTRTSAEKVLRELREELRGSLDGRVLALPYETSGYFSGSRAMSDYDSTIKVERSVEDKEHIEAILRKIRRNGTTGAVVSPEHYKVYRPVNIGLAKSDEEEKGDD